MKIKSKKQYIETLKKMAPLVNKKTLTPCERCEKRTLAIQVWIWEQVGK